MVLVAADAVHGRLLEPKLYTDALTERQAYRRLYADVLTAPEVRALAGDLLDGLNLDPQEQRDVLAVSAAVLRLAFPPEVLNDLMDQLLVSLLAYIRGDADHLDVELSLLGALERTDEAGAIIARRALANATTLVAANLDDYERAARTFLSDLGAGQVPTAVPAGVVGGASDSAIVASVEEATAHTLPAHVREQVVGAIGSGERRDALIEAGAEALRRHLDDIATELAAGGQLRVDVLDALGAASPRARDEIVQRLTTIRAALRWVPPRTGALGAGAAMAGVVALLLVHRRRPVFALLLAGGVLIACGVLAWLVRALVSHRVPSPIEAAAADRRLSPSLRDLMLDVDDAIRTSLRESVGAQVRSVVVVGTALAGVAVGIVASKWLRQPDHRRAPLVAASLVAAGALAAGAVTRTNGDGRAERACNGHAELCARPYDEVVQAATHNAMSSPEVVRIWPEHDADIRAQLDYGVRTLMVDTAYWTAIEHPDELGSARRPIPADVAAALFDTLGNRLEGRPGAYLCHSQCALGAVSFTATLRSIKLFLDANPDEVVTLIIQDAVSPRDTEAAFEEADLLDTVYDGSPSEDWPTLGELIGRGQRLVVFSEQQGPPPPWYRRAFDNIQDTPYGTTSPEDFVCRRARGPADASLFLLNHWVRREAPDRADAAVVNARQFIVDRARECAAERGQLPDFIAVDFFSIGDVIGAVDELNGVR